MILTAALVLLLSASDTFDQFSGWQDGFRLGMETAIVQVEGDSCLRISTSQLASDIVKSFPRPVLASERPFAQAHIYVPAFDQWPTGTGNFCGFRLTITRTQGGYVWPAIFLAHDAGNPCLVCRVLGDHFGRALDVAGWWTLGVSCAVDNRLAFYAHPGRVALTEADRFFTDPDGYTTVQSFDGWFLQVTQGAWFFGDVQLWENVPPLRIERAGGAVALTPGYPGMLLEKSTDLSSWLPLDGLNDLMTEAQQFYRIREHQ